MNKNDVFGDCFQPSILFLLHPYISLFTCDCFFHFHLYARSSFIFYLYGANDVGFMRRAVGQSRDRIKTSILWWQHEEQ